MYIIEKQRELLSGTVYNTTASEQNGEMPGFNQLVDKSRHKFSENLVRKVTAKVIKFLPYIILNGRHKGPVRSL